jgi:hypothetical protein
MCICIIICGYKLLEGQNKELLTICNLLLNKNILFYFNYSIVTKHTYLQSNYLLQINLIHNILRFYFN